MDNTDDMT